MENVLLFRVQALSISEALDILENCTPDKCITAPVKKPKAGQVFIYKTVKDGNEGKLSYKPHRSQI